MNRNKSDLSSFCSFIRTLKMNYISGFYTKGFRWRCYGVAVLAVAIALLLNLLVAPLIEHESPFLLFFAAMMMSAWYGGMGAGVPATAMSALVIVNDNGISFPPNLDFRNTELFLFVISHCLNKSVIRKHEIYVICNKIFRAKYIKQGSIKINV